LCREGSGGEGRERRHPSEAFHAGELQKWEAADAWEAC